jgi:AcrR family transcriptional regulator
MTIDAANMTVEDVARALVEQEVDRPVREMTDLLRSGAPDADVARAAGLHFAELLSQDRTLLLRDDDYCSKALCDPEARRRYASRRAAQREALERAMQARLDASRTTGIATAMLALVSGLLRDKLIDPDAVPDELLGEAIDLICAGARARAERPARHLAA